MICNHCGRTLIPGQKVCPGCRQSVETNGRNLIKSPTGKNTPPALNSDFSKSSNTQKEAAKGTLYVLLGIGIFLVLLGVGAWLLSAAN